MLLEERRLVTEYVLIINNKWLDLTVILDDLYHFYHFIIIIYHSLTSLFSI